MNKVKSISDFEEEATYYLDNTSLEDFPPFKKYSKNDNVIFILLETNDLKPICDTTDIVLIKLKYVKLILID